MTRPLAVWAYSMLGALAVLWSMVTRVAPAFQNGFIPAALWAGAAGWLTFGVFGFWQMRWWGVAVLLSAGLIVFYFVTAFFMFSPAAIAGAAAISATAFGPAFVIARAYQDRFRA